MTMAMGGVGENSVFAWLGGGGDAKEKNGVVWV